ncbi:MAG: sulfite exporter TauE/SafE family protein [Nitrospinae bacterium]|nr:sulfite exporter TauE/SafE family protein [Nitrospinota bacterium]
MLEWYAWLSQLNAAVSEPLTAWSERLNIPLLTALLLGLLGSTAPCQLTTNASAMALVAQRLADLRGAWKTALAYTAGKVVVYTLVGSLILALGLQLDLATIPVAVWARKALGPLMLLIGCYLLGMFQLNVGVGHRISRWLEGRVPREGMPGAFVLGLVFSLAFCPTLFWLFFGLLIPLALSSQGGWMFPGTFAVGTALPLLGFTYVVSLGGTLAHGYVGRLKGLDRYLRRIAGVVLLAAGLNDTLTYWAF